MMGSLVKISYNSKQHLFMQLRCGFNLLAATVNYTGKHNFCHMETNLFLMHFFTLNSNMLLELPYRPQFSCDTNF